MLIRRIIGLAFAGMAASMVVGAAAALTTKQRLVQTTDTDADEIVVAGIFGPLAYQSKAKQFKGGTLECWYGGGVLDLREAVLAPEGATLQVRAIFGGGQILVPPTWIVESHVRGIGGLSDVRTIPDQTDDGPRLTIEGLLFCGGFAVTSELVEGEAKWLDEMNKKLEPEPEAALTV